MTKTNLPSALQDQNPDEELEKHNKAYSIIYPSEDLIKTQAKVMQDYLLTYVVSKQVNLSHCYGCLAKMWGFESWAQMKVVINKIE